MASQKIEFALSSKFQGEGFENATQLIKQNTKEMQAAKAGLGEISSAFKNVSPAAGSAVGAVGTFVDAFAKGGIIGGAITLAMKGISEAVGYFTEKAKEAAENAKKYAEVIKNDLLSAMGSAEARLKAVQSEMSKANREAKDLLKVLNGDVASEANNKIYEIKVKARDELDKAMNDEARNLIKAAADRQVAEVEAQAKVEMASNSVDAYRSAVDNATNTLEASEAAKAAADEAATKLQSQYAEVVLRRTQLAGAIETVETDYRNGVIGLNDYTARLKTARMNLSTYEEQHKDEIAALAEADRKQAESAKAATEADYALTQAKNDLHASVQALTKAEQDGEIATREAVAKECEAADKMAEAADSLAAETAALEEQVDLMYDNFGEVAQSAYDLAKAMDATKDQLDSAELAEGSKPTEKNKQVTVNANISSWHPDIDKIPEPKKIDAGQFVAFKDAQAAAREAARQQRDFESELKGKMGAEFSNYFRIMNLPESHRSVADKALIQHYNESVIPQMATKLGVEFTTKFLGDASKKVLMRNDLDDFFGNKNGKLVTAISAMIKDTCTAK